MNISVLIPNKDLPAIKQASKELGVDAISGEIGEENTELHLLISDYSLLIYIGIIAGMNISYTGLRNPLTQLTDDLQRKLEAITNKKKD